MSVGKDKKLSFEDEEFGVSILVELGRWLDMQL